MSWVNTLDTVETRFGVMSVLPSDSPIGESLRRYGEWAGAELDFAAQFISDGAVVIDGGANVGTHTLAFAKLCGPSGHVVSIEASPELAEIVTRNMEANALDNVEVVNAALADDHRTVLIPHVVPDVHQNSGALRVSDVEADGENSGYARVKTVRLDDLNLSAVALVKLDIEGGEFSAVLGARALIEKCRPVFMLEMLTLHQAVPIIELFRGLRYIPFFCTFSAYNPHNHRGEAENMFGHAREACLVFVPAGHMAPRVTEGASLHAIEDYDQLAKMFLEMPRYGDATEHDRIPTLLVTERDQLRDQLTGDDNREVKVSEERLMAEIKHVWATISDDQQKLVLLAEDMTRVLNANFGERMASLDKHLVLIDERLAAFDVSSGSVKSMAALNEALVARVDALEKKVEQQMATTEAATRATEVTLSTMRDVIERNASELSAIASRSGRLVENFQKLESKVTTGQSDLSRAANGAKSELSSLKEALLGRVDDRSSLVLAMEMVKEKIDRLEKALG